MAVSIASEPPTPEAGDATAPVLLRALDARGVLRLTLNRPARFNALSEALLDALTEAFAEAGASREVRVVVLAANGRAFCAGHDLGEMYARPDEVYYRELFARCGRMMQGIVACPKPVIARVHGMATAAGCQLVATCDLAVAAEDATLAVSGIANGLFCSTPAVALSRNVPVKRAFEMLVTGEFVDARTALERGLVNRVAPADALDTAVDGLLDSILDKSQVAVETGKRMFYAQLEKPLADAYDYAGEVMACNMMAEDAREGIGAFLDKRAARWRHR